MGILSVESITLSLCIHDYAVTGGDTEGSAGSPQGDLRGKWSAHTDTFIRYNSLILFWLLSTIAFSACIHCSYVCCILC